MVLLINYLQSSPLYCSPSCWYIISKLTLFQNPGKKTNLSISPLSSSTMMSLSPKLKTKFGFWGQKEGFCPQDLWLLLLSLPPPWNILAHLPPLTTSLLSVGNNDLHEHFSYAIPSPKITLHKMRLGLNIEVIIVDLWISTRV